jgi:hypothetical protein
MKSLVGFWQTAPPTVTRLESHEHYFYAAVDLTDSYQSAEKPEYFDNPYAGKIVREYLFIKPLDAVLIMDRIQSISKTVPATSVTKTALIHLAAAPSIENPNHVNATIGTQMARITTLVPSNPGYLVVNEGVHGQHRLQISTSGQEQSYLINLIEAKGASEAGLATQVEEKDNMYVIRITHPTKGNALINFEKGSLSAGGSFGYSTTTTTPPVMPFSTTVAVPSVTENGVSWTAGADPVLGVEDEAGGRGLRVIPNPARSAFKIVLDETDAVSGRYQYEVTNLQGQTLDTQSFSSRAGLQDHQFSTGHLQAGLYIVRVRANSRVFVGKVQIVR